MADSTEVKVIKLETQSEIFLDRLFKLEDKVHVLEENHFKQVAILSKLAQSVDTLLITVSSLQIIVTDMKEVTAKIDKGLEVTKARFSIIIAILSAIGLATVTGLVKILFFLGVAG